MPAWLAVLAVALVVRLPLLREPSVIGDEVFTRDVVALPMAAAMDVVVEDAVHPPLHSLAGKAWAAVAGGEVHDLRALSLVLGVLAVLLAALAARSWGRSGGAGLLAGLLVALSDAQAFHGHPARSYSLYVCLVTALLMATLHAVRTGARPGSWLLFAACGLLAVGTHYVAWLFLLAILAGVWAMGRPREALRLSFAAGGVGILFLPWAYLASQAIQRKGGLASNLGWIEAPTVAHPVWVLAVFTGAPPGRAGTALALLAGAGLAVLIAVRMVRERAPAAPGSARELAPVLLAALLPPVLLCLLARPPLGLPIWGTRHLLPAQSCWAIALAAGVFLLGRRRRVAAAALGLGLVALQATSAAQGMRARRVVPYAEAARYLEAERAPGEPLFTTSPHSLGLPIGYHMGGPRLGALPESGEVPARLWLAYRPERPEESARARALLDAGYSASRGREFARRPEDPGRTRVERFERGKP